MAIDGVVRQTANNGLVVDCTLSVRCFRENGCTSKGQERTCLLSVPDHGTRCAAWESDVTKWIIDADQTKIKQLS